MSLVSDLLDPAWKRSDQLFGLIAPRALHTRAIALRHPPVFYLGHLPAFAWNQVAAGVMEQGALHPTFDALFERGIDPLTVEPTPDPAASDWPAVAQILDYRDLARSRLTELEEALLDLDDPLAEQGRILHVVREHEQMHHETLLYLFQQLDPQELRRSRDFPGLSPGATARAPRRLPVRAGRAVLGTTLDDVPFAWDNELASHEVQVPAFLLEDLPVTVERYLAFVQDGGYRKRGGWSDEAWAWKKALDLKHPVSWRKGADGYEVRSLFAWHPIDEVLGWPVLVSHAEARAFAAWSGARLPTEPELMRAAHVGPDDIVREYPWGDEQPAGHANLGFVTGGLECVGQRPRARGPWGHHDLVGNAWAWTDTPFRPYPGFVPWVRTYPGYSADFFDDQHFVVCGASWATAPNLARRSFRNWYQGYYGVVFAGVRLAWDA